MLFTKSLTENSPLNILPTKFSIPVIILFITGIDRIRFTNSVSFPFANSITSPVCSNA